MKTLSRGKTNIVVNALAGTGKTTTIVEAVNRLITGKKRLTGSDQQELIWDEICKEKTEDILVISFSKRIVEELKEKLPSSVPAMTCHSFGYQTMFKNGITRGYSDSKLDFCVLKALCNYSKIEWEEKTLKNYFSQIHRKYPKVIKAMTRLIELARTNLIHLDLLSITELDSQLSKLISYYNIEWKKDEHYEVIQDTIANAAKLALELTYQCHSDMIYIPLRNKMFIPKRQLVFIDESQDTSIAQQELALKAGFRHVVLGDVNQAIFSFAGADSKACENLTKILKSGINTCKELPLTKSRRCPKVAVGLVKHIVPAFEVMPEAKKGNVYHIDISNLTATAKEGDMILCRTNAPLLKLLYFFYKNGKKAKIEGKQIGDDIIKTLEEFDAEDIYDLKDKINNWKNIQLEKLEGKEANSEAIINLIDKSDCLLSMLKLLNDKDKTLPINALTLKIKEIFEDDVSCVRLLTIHKSKGLEANNVFLFGQNLLPHPRSKGDVQLQQEANLEYVAKTRFKENFYFVKETKQEEELYTNV